MNIWNLANPITQGIILISMMLEIEECFFFIQSLLYLLPNPLSTPIPHNPQSSQMIHESNLSSWIYRHVKSRTQFYKTDYANAKILALA